jgi:hypothetical protein
MNRKMLGLFLLFSFFLILPLAHATTDVIGDMSANDGGDSGVIFANAITSSASGTLQSIGFNIQVADGNGRVAIYDNTAAPNQVLLGESSSLALISGWNNFPMPAVTITTGHTYYLAFQIDSATAHPYVQSGTGSNYKETYSYNTFPDPYGSSTNNGFWVSANMNMTYEITTIDNILTSFSCSPNPAVALYTNITCIGRRTNYNYDYDVNYSMWNGNDLLNSSLTDNVTYTSTFTAGVFPLQFNSSAGTYYNANDTGLTFLETVTTTTTTTTPMPSLSVSCSPNPTNISYHVVCWGHKTAAHDSDVNYTLWANNTMLNSSNGTSVYYNNTFAKANYLILFNSSAGANYTANPVGARTTLYVSNQPIVIPNEANLILIAFMGIFVLVISAVIVINTYNNVINSSDPKDTVKYVFVAVFIILLLLSVLVFFA